MRRATVSTTIAAPVEKVFETIADVESFQRAIPHIIDIEFLSGQRSGTGTRFRETRETNGKRAITELEITECVTDDRVRMVADSHGTIWDSLFEVRGVPEGTELTITMEAKAHQLAARLATPLVMPLIRSAMKSDLEMVKLYCENGGRPADPASAAW